MKKGIKVTGKRQVPIMLPEVMTKVYQPNRVTDGHMDFTLYQGRIFNFIMLKLQDAVKASMNNKKYDQLEMFRSPDVIRIPIPLNEIVDNPSLYGKVKDAIQDMSARQVHFPFTNAQGIEMRRFTGFIRAEIPERPNYTSDVIIEIETRVAEILVNIDKNAQNLPINYTSYYYEIGQHSKCVYTFPIYRFLSSWKSKGGVSIAIDDLKERLSLADKYDRFFDFKKRVLDVVQSELLEKSDLWFNCNTKDFKTFENGKVILNFKIITPEFKKELAKSDDYILNMLKNHYQLSSSQLEPLTKIFKDDDLDRKLIIKRIGEIEEFIYKNNENINKPPIENKGSYMLKALLKQFA